MNSGGTRRLRFMIRSFKGTDLGLKGKDNHRRQSLIFSLLCLFATQSTYIFSFDYHKPLTFEERVTAQEAVERVYYNHRIWPKENPQLKPPFEAMVTRKVMEGKVADYLKKSAALGKYWERPVTGEQLQAEMDRMAKQTKDPATLREIFAALNNDPYLIAECLARPVLADRLIRNWYASDSRFHEEARNRAKDALSMASACFIKDLKGSHYWKQIYRMEDEVQGTSNISESLSPETIVLGIAEFARRMKETPEEGKSSGLIEEPDGFVILFTLHKDDREIEVEALKFAKTTVEAWLAGLDLNSIQMDEQYAQMPYLYPSVRSAVCVDEWANGSMDDVPDGRFRHTAVWTGNEMIVWGGDGNHTNAGARYNPSTDSWMPTSTGPNVPKARFNHTAIWTGIEMIVWGGSDYGSDSYCNTGGRYNPSSDTWSATSTGANVPSKRHSHTAVWTGSEMIIWGGNGAGETGGRYNPQTDSWVPTSTGANVPPRRYYHTAIWTGTEMIIWGGLLSGLPNSGARYNPISDTWIPTSTNGIVPSGRYHHSVVWTGSEMIIWGGFSVVGGKGFYLNSGGRYSPSSDSWYSISTGANVPAGRDLHSAVWTGSKMIIWGGYNYDGTDHHLDTGGQYDPSMNSWTPTTALSYVPSPRYSHTAVWTGSEMIIWGGIFSDSFDHYLNTGGRYDPDADSWVPTSTGVEVPSPRWGHTAMWTGSEMIIWGGSDAARYDTGGRYVPSTDHWISTSNDVGVPSARVGHTAIWTGREMIIWGGLDDEDAALGSGGRYDPVMDTWRPTSVGIAAPSPRSSFTAVWTGERMIIWGGFDGTYTNTGSLYDPVSDTWSATAISDSTPAGRERHTAIWTGAEMIIWGGNASQYSSYLYTGGRYEPLTGTWVATSTGLNIPGPRIGHTAVWSGSEMIVWGGKNSAGETKNSGGRYNPVLDSWVATSLNGAPAKRKNHTAIWTGNEMIAWGGDSLNTGGRYIPASDTWISTPAGMKTPLGRTSHSAIWTGSSMFIWGGLSGPLNSGGIFVPSGPIPATPANIYASSSCSSVTLTWATSPDAVSYSVKRGASCGTPDVEFSGAMSPFSDGSAVAGVPYYYWVVSVGECATSYNSACVVGIRKETPLTPMTSNNGPICAGQTLNLSASFISGATYSWTGPNGFTSNEQNPSILNATAAASGTYTVTVTVSGCTSPAGTTTVIVAPLPAPTIIGVSTGCSSPGVSLTTQSYATYQWQRSGHDIPGATGQTYIATLSGPYSVRVTSAFGCAGTSPTHHVTVYFCPSSEISPSGSIYPFRFVKDGRSPTGYFLYFQMVSGAAGYNIYIGAVGEWYSHGGAPFGIVCDIHATDLGTGEMRTEVSLTAGNRYYLITAFGASSEGPSGFDSMGSKIPDALSTCAP